MPNHCEHIADYYYHHAIRMKRKSRERDAMLSANITYLIAAAPQPSTSLK